MNDHSEHRLLLIEQLEKRTLLSGDLLVSFADWSNDDRREHSGRLSGQRSFGRGAELREFDDDRFQRNRGNDDGRDQRRSERHDRRSGFDSSPQSSAPQYSAPEGERIDVTVYVRVPVTVVPSIPSQSSSVSNQPNDRPGSPARESSTAANAQVTIRQNADITVDLPAASPVDAELAEETNDRVQAEQPPTAAIRMTEADAQATAAETLTDAGDQIADRLVSFRFSMTRSELSSLTGGVQAGFVPQSATSDDMAVDNRFAEPGQWRLPQETLDRLRNTIEQWQDDSPAPHDLAINSWLVGPGGLIDFGDSSLQLQTPGGAAVLINVQLDTALGLHRSLELLAADEVIRTEDAVRDAVLAALSGEDLDTAQPVAEATPMRVPALAYPGAALLATLALASQRKRAKDQEFEDDED